MIEIRCCHTLAEAAPLRQAMNALNLASARPDPFSTFEFYRNHLRNAARLAAPDGARLWLLLAFRGRELVGYAALKRRTHRVLGVVAAKIDWLMAHAADRPHVVARPADAGEVAAALYQYLLDRRRDWSLLEFQQQDAGSPLRPPPAAAARGCRLREWPNPANATITLRWQSLAAYFAALSKKSRSNVSRQMRSLLAAGDVQLLESSDPRALPALFALYRGVEAHSWKARTEAGLDGAAGWGAHYAGLMAPDQPMRIAIQVLLLDGAPVAGLICGAFERGLYALHIVYDERLARLAPGSAILMLGVRMAIEGGYQFFNLLRGSGYYKTRWLADMTETHSVQVYRPATPFYWRRLLGDTARRWSIQAPTAADALFNPERRAIDGATAGPEPPPWSPDPAARQEHASLVARVLRAPGVHLSAAALAAALPFATGRAPTPRAAMCASERMGAAPPA